MLKVCLGLTNHVGAQHICYHLDYYECHTLSTKPLLFWDTNLLFRIHSVLKALRANKRKQEYIFGATKVFLEWKTILLRITGSNACIIFQAKSRTAKFRSLLALSH